jgi:hypothetical protein
VKTRADAGQSGADDQHVEMFWWCGRYHGPSVEHRHGRACPGHPRLLLQAECKDVDPRDKQDMMETSVIPRREQSERTRNLEAVARDSGLALTPAPE